MRSGPFGMTRRGVIASLTIATLLPAIGWAAAPRLSMPELYGDKDFSERAILFNGTEVALRGFMAPPLKVDSNFFVLTMTPMAVCPFCAEAAQWPEDIVVVYVDGAVDVAPYDILIEATGRLDLGTWTDPDTGFVSRVRVLDADYRRLPTVIGG